MGGILYVDFLFIASIPYKTYKVNRFIDDVPAENLNKI